MTDSEKKAVALMEEANRKVSSGRGFFSALFGGGTRLEEACEAYTKAANMFKVAKNWNQAGNAFCQAASLYIKSGSQHDAATCYVDAGNCYKKTDPKAAISCYLKVVDTYTDMGKFTMAAKHHIHIAEIYETEIIDLNKAIQHYEQAADYFKGEEANSSANKCSLKVAHYAAQMEEYDKAITIYEQVGTQCLDSSLLKYSAKDHFFRAALCHLCVDLLNAQHALQRYEELYPAFSESRECKLIKNLMLHIEEQNVDGFTDVVKEYDAISRFDQWYTTLLLRIKKILADVPDLR